MVIVVSCFYTDWKKAKIENDWIVRIVNQAGQGGNASPVAFNFNSDLYAYLFQS
jgi:hypothetical protein